MGTKDRNDCMSSCKKNVLGLTVMYTLKRLENLFQKNLSIMILF